MRTATMGMAAAVAALLLAAGPAAAKKCPADSVPVGHACVDKYEASAWETTDAATIKNIQKGKIDALSDLALATQRGTTGPDYGAACPNTGNGCKTVYAVSLAGVTPSRFLDWFQAAAACRNAGKRLATNQEWQLAALGTPDPGTDNGTSDCAVASSLSPTGSRNLCMSDVGAFDMVGNVWEWVADWGDVATGCQNWGGAGTDLSCVGGNGAGGIPGALWRGGDFDDGTNAGVFAANGVAAPHYANDVIGFRCAREL